MKHHTFHDLVGVGLRTPHLDYFSQNQPELSWLEIHSENYFQPNATERHQLQSFASNIKLAATVLVCRWARWNVLVKSILRNLNH